MMNPMQIMQMMKNGGNPQQMIMNMMRQQAGNNPVMNNALQMMEKAIMQDWKIWHETFAKRET